MLEKPLNSFIKKGKRLWITHIFCPKWHQIAQFGHFQSVSVISNQTKISLIKSFLLVNRHQIPLEHDELKTKITCQLRSVIRDSYQFRGKSGRVPDRFRFESD
jgi:hypothetical protein